VVGELALAFAAVSWKMLVFMSKEPKTRIVGRQNPTNYTDGGLVEADGFLKLVNTLRQGRPFIPRGVFRFKSFEEADEWTMKMLTRPEAEPRK
jgi:hypothetical protein